MTKDGAFGDHCTQGFSLEGGECFSVVWSDKEGLAEWHGIKDQGENTFISRICFQKFRHSIKKPESFIRQVGGYEERVGGGYREEEENEGRRKGGKVRGWEERGRRGGGVDRLGIEREGEEGGMLNHGN